MQARLDQPLRLIKRRSRSGQSLVLVAFAFIMLIAFVGIAVDVAMLFVRFSSLRRAVDSASIAVAGQVRQGVNFGELNAVAQEYINLQSNPGISLKSVLVENCESDIENFKKGAAGAGQTVTDPIADLTYTGVGSPVPADWSWVPGYFGATRLPPYSELCKPDPQKLVRVSAQIDSDTTFLSLLGFKTIRLSVSSVSQTALLDVAVVLDASPSMANDTTNDMQDLSTYPLNKPLNQGGDNHDSLTNFQPFLDLGLTQAEAGGPRAIRSECSDTRWIGAQYPPDNNIPDSSGPHQGAANYSWGGCCNDPITQDYPLNITAVTGSTNAATNAAAVFDQYNLHLTSNGTSGVAVDPTYWITDNPQQAQSNIMHGSTPYGAGRSSASVVDGQGDVYNYSSLICQPFKKVRDAARRFINRLDFVRGDRLVLVTFAGEADTVLPQAWNSTTDVPPIIVDQTMANLTLNFKVGMSVSHDWEPASGGYKDRGAYWLCSTTNDNFHFSSTNYASFVSNKKYWSVAQCPDTNTGGGIRAARVALTNAFWVRRESVWVIVMLSDGYPNRTNKWTSFTGATPLVVGDSHDQHNNTADMVIAPGSVTLAQYCDSTQVDPITGQQPDSHYATKPQYCTGFGQPTNIDKINNHDSTVYDPSSKLYQISPTNDSSFGFCPKPTFCDVNDSAYCTNTSWTGPYGVVNIPAVEPLPIWPRNANEPLPSRDNRLPHCTSADPDIRHFCMVSTTISTSKSGTVGPSSSLSPATDASDGAAAAHCDPRYDAQDYARDQADEAGLLVYSQPTPTSNQSPGNFIAMFSIFFSHSANGATPVLSDNILGVKMMRYIADAGDNGSIDNHLQEWYRKNKWVEVSTGNVLQSQNASAAVDQPANIYWPDSNNILYPPSNPDYKGTDPCNAYDYRNYYGQGWSITGPTDTSTRQLPMPDPARTATNITYETIAQQDCGQYFYAQDITAVNRAFTDIAGRLFTRLSR